MKTGVVRVAGIANGSIGGQASVSSIGPWAGGPWYGDLRDWPAIALWAKDIAAQLKIQAPAEPERQSGPTVVL